MCTPHPRRSMRATTLTETNAGRGWLAPVRLGSVSRRPGESLGVSGHRGRHLVTLESGSRDALDYSPSQTLVARSTVAECFSTSPKFCGSACSDRACFWSWTLAGAVLIARYQTAGRRLVLASAMLLLLGGLFSLSTRLNSATGAAIFACQRGATAFLYSGRQRKLPRKLEILLSAK